MKVVVESFSKCLHPWVSPSIKHGMNIIMNFNICKAKLTLLMILSTPPSAHLLNVSITIHPPCDLFLYYGLALFFFKIDIFCKFFDLFLCFLPWMCGHIYVKIHKLLSFTPFKVFFLVFSYNVIDEYQQIDFNFNF